jgi:hypothetical protein
MKSIVAATVLGCFAGLLQAQSIQSRPVAVFVDGSAAEPFVTRDGARGFVVTWQARLGDGITALRFRHVDADGRAGRAGEIARGDGWFVNWADFPSLAVLDNGDWLAHWLQRSGPGHAYDIHASRSRDAGRTWSAPERLHDDGTRSEHGFVSFAPAGDGDAHAVWLDGRQTGANDAGHGHGKGDHGTSAGAMTLRAARVSRDGIDEAAQIDDRVCDCCQTDAVRVGRGTLVVYRDRSADEIRDVRLARHDGRQWLASESLFGDGWRIQGCPVNGPAIAARGNDVIAAAYSEAGGQPGVRVRTSADGGANWRPSVTLAAGRTLGRLDATALDHQRFLVSRLDLLDGAAELRVSLHDEAGSVTADRLMRSLPADRLVGFPRMAASGAAVLLAWTEVEAGVPVVRASMIAVDDDAD